MDNFFIGDMGTGGAPSVEPEPFGPLSPEDLSKLSRPLEPAEQKAVADFKKSEEAKKTAAAQKAQAVVQSVNQMFQQTTKALQQPSPVAEIPWWQLGLGAVAGVGVALFLRRRKK